MDNPDPIHILGWFLIVAVLFIIIPKSIHSLVCFLQKAHKTKFIQNRLPNVAYLIIVIGIITLLIEQPLIMVVRVLDLWTIPNWILDGVFCLCWFALFITLSGMSYLLYFRLQFNLSIINSNWQKEINEGAIGKQPFEVSDVFFL